MRSLALITLLVACGDVTTSTNYNHFRRVPPEGLRQGVSTWVTIRPDVLGTARDLPVSADTMSINGAKITHFGTLVSADASWIVLDANGGRNWISLDTVTRCEQTRIDRMTDHPFLCGDYRKAFLSRSDDLVTAGKGSPPHQVDVSVSFPPEKPGIRRSGGLDRRGAPTVGLDDGSSIRARRPQGGARPRWRP